MFVEASYLRIDENKFATAPILSADDDIFHSVLTGLAADQNRNDPDEAPHHPEKREAPGRDCRPEEKARNESQEFGADCLPKAQSRRRLHAKRKHQRPIIELVIQSDTADEVPPHHKPS